MTITRIRTKKESKTNETTWLAEVAEDKDRDNGNYKEGRQRWQRKMNTKHHIHRQKGGVAEHWLNCGCWGAGGGKRLKITQNYSKIGLPTLPHKFVCVYFVSLISCTLHSLRSLSLQLDHSTCIHLVVLEPSRNNRNTFFCNQDNLGNYRYL